jgi:hypothetical protein
MERRLLEYSAPTLRVHGGVAVLTQQNAKLLPSCQDDFNASPNAQSQANHPCESFCSD